MLALGAVGLLSDIPFWWRCLSVAHAETAEKAWQACAAGAPVGLPDWIIVGVLVAGFLSTMLWMGLVHAGLKRAGRLRSRLPAWIAGICWVVLPVNLVLPYWLLLRYVAAMGAARAMAAVIVGLWVLDIFFYATIAVPALGPGLPPAVLLWSEIAGALLGPVGLGATGFVVLALNRRAAQI